MLGSNHRRMSGVTIVELSIVVALIPLVIVGIVVILQLTLSDSKKVALQSTYDSEAGFSADWLEHDVRFASEFKSNIASPYTDVYPPAGGWKYQGSGPNNRVLILSSPASTSKQGNSTRVLSYKKDLRTVGVPFNCTNQLTYNEILKYNSIYFVKDKTLYKRYITDTTSPLCNDQIQKQSCPSELRASWSPKCKASDEIIAENVTKFSVDYFAASGTNPAINSPIEDQYSDPTSLNEAEAVEINFVITQPNHANPISSNNTIRITRVN